MILLRYQHIGDGKVGGVWYFNKQSPVEVEVEVRVDPEHCDRFAKLMWNALKAERKGKHTDSARWYAKAAALPGYQEFHDNEAHVLTGIAGALDLTPTI